MQGIKLITNLKFCQLSQNSVTPTLEQLAILIIQPLFTVYMTQFAIELFASNDEHLYLSQFCQQWQSFIFASGMPDNYICHKFAIDISQWWHVIQSLLQVYDCK